MWWHGNALEKGNQAKDYGIYMGNFINAIVIDEPLGFKWRITRFYG